MAMKEPIVIRPELADQFFAAMENGRVVLFTAPCGFGKSVTAQVLLACFVWKMTKNSLVHRKTLYNAAIFVV